MVISTEPISLEMIVVTVVGAVTTKLIVWFVSSPNSSTKTIV